MYSYTENLNENVGTLITELEDKMPKGISITAFNSTADGVDFTGNTKTYEDIAAFAINLKDIECIDNTFIESVSENKRLQALKYLQIKEVRIWIQSQRVREIYYYSYLV